MRFYVRPLDYNGSDATVKAFIIVGTEQDLVSEFGREVVARNYKGYAPVEISAREATIDDIRGLLFQESLLGASGFIWIRDGEAFDSKKFKAFVDLLSHEPSQGLLVTAVEKKKDVARWRALEGRDHVKVRVLDARDAESLVAALVRKAAKDGVTLSAAAARELLSRTESYPRASRELEKLLAYYHGCDAIGIGEVQRYVNLEPQSGLFDFIDAVLARDFTKSLVYLERFIAAGEKPDAAFHVLLSVFVSFVRAATMFRIGKKDKKVAEELGIYEWQARKYRAFAKKWTWSQAVEAFWELLRADARLKSGETRDVKVLLEKTILVLSART
jgi:DNA polymerase III delta subunit